jgi:ATP-dependent Zn protease
MSDTNLVGRVLADSVSREAVDTLLRDQKQLATEVLQAHRDKVIALRDALLERHELVGEEITDVIMGTALTVPQV